MSTAERDQLADLRNIYQDLALALGAAYHLDQEPATDVADRVAHLWALAVLRLTGDTEDLDAAGIPAVVEPDPEAPADLDIDGYLDHVAEAVDGAPEPDRAPAGLRMPTVRTAALGWAAAAFVLGIVLGLTGSGPVVLPALLPPIVTALIAAYVGAGRMPGALWAVGLAPMVLLLAGGRTSWFATLGFVVLVEGFAQVLRLAGRPASLDSSTRAGRRLRRRPLELALVVYTLAALTVRSDLTAVVFVCCVGALLWRRRWTALVAAALCGLIVLVPSLALREPGGGVLPDVLTYLALTVHWGRAAFNRAWLADLLSFTELGLVLTGRTLRATYRTVRRHTDAALAPLSAPSPGSLRQADAGMRYCWTCHQRKPRIAAGTSPAICEDCLRRAGRRDGEALHRKWCDRCARFQPFTHRGCLHCWEKGSRS